MQMKWYEKKHGKKRLTGGAIMLIGFAAILAVILIVAVYFYFRISGLSANAVPIVSQAPEIVIQTPEPLEIVEGEPEDITEDFDDPAPAEPTEMPIYYVQPIMEERMNILMIGSDSRSSESEDGRSDTMMLLSYDFKNNRISLISFLRDIWVPIEGHSNNRLNAAFRFGGPGLAVNTINRQFDLDIQNFIVVDFSSMEKLVNRIGGIDIDITKKEVDYYKKMYDWNFKEGKNRINGEQALIHSRNRKLGGGDFERTRRQRDVLLAVYKKLMGTKDLEKLSDLFSFFMENTQTNMTPLKLFSMGVQAISSDGDLKIDQGRIPIDGSWNYGRKDGRSVIVVDFAKNAEWLKEFLYNAE